MPAINLDPYNVYSLVRSATIILRVRCKVIARVLRGIIFVFAVRREIMFCKIIAQVSVKLLPYINIYIYIHGTWSRRRISRTLVRHPTVNESPPSRPEKKIVLQPKRRQLTPPPRGKQYLQICDQPPTIHVGISSLLVRDSKQGHTKHISLFHPIITTNRKTHVPGIWQAGESRPTADSGEQSNLETIQSGISCPIYFQND